MAEPTTAKARSDDNAGVLVAASEDSSDTEDSSAAPLSREEPEDESNKPRDEGEEKDKQSVNTEEVTPASATENKKKKKNRGKKSGKKGYQVTDEDTKLKKDSQAGANKGPGQKDDRPKEGQKKQGQQQKKKESTFLPDKGGTYTLWVRKPYPGYTHEEAYRTFVLFGSVAEINFLEQNFFVRYHNKDSAAAAMKRLKGSFSMEPARVKNPSKNMNGPQHPPVPGGTVFKDSTPQPTEVYIGNISTSSSEREMEKLLEDTKFTSLKYHNKNGKGFAFVQYPSLNSAKRAVSRINGQVLQGRALLCRLCHVPGGGDASELSLLGNYPQSQSSHNSAAFEVLVKNLHPETKENHLYTLFSRYGGATYVQTKFVPNKNCVEALVGLHSDWFAQAVMKELQGQIIDGRMITVSSNLGGSLPASAGASHGHHSGRHHGSHGHHGNMQNSSHHSRSFHQPMMSHPHPAITKLQQATDLAHRVDALIDEVLDDCHYCERIKMLMSELQYALFEVSEEVGH